MSQLNEIYQGWKNLLFKNEVVEAIAETRSKICFDCPIRKDNYCNKELGGCGCYLEAKLRSPDSKCPKEKW